MRDNDMPVSLSARVGVVVGLQASLLSVGLLLASALPARLSMSIRSGHTSSWDDLARTIAGVVLDASSVLVGVALLTVLLTLALPLGETIMVTAKRDKTRVVPLLSPVRAAIDAYLRKPDARGKFDPIGLRIIGGAPDKMTARIAADRAQWTDIIKSVNIDLSK